MTVATTEKISPTASTELWEPEVPPLDLIFDDGEPAESNRHRIGIKRVNSLSQYSSSSSQ